MWLASAALFWTVSASSDEPESQPTGMIKIPAGTFRMGAKGHNAEANEGPVHNVTVASFFIDTTEVTVGAYKACVDKGACVPPTLRAASCTYTKNNPQLPVNCVSFDEADRYCLAQGKRLPTEAEWEYAARGAAGNEYPWGFDRPSCERAITRNGDKTAEGCSDGPTEVGGHPAGRSPFGVQDMAGNVEEWVADWYDDRLPTAPTENPKGPEIGTAKVMRGGSWQSPHHLVRTSTRSWGSLVERGATVGFRCAKLVSIR